MELGNIIPIFRRGKQDSKFPCLSEGEVAWLYTQRSTVQKGDRMAFNVALHSTTSCQYQQSKKHKTPYVPSQLLCLESKSLLNVSPD